MSIRTILTSPPVQSCDVCARRLLRGERAEVFIQAGQRRTVCELCAPRASDAGWTRERELDLDAHAGPRERPPRGVLARLLRSFAQPARPREGARGRAGERGGQTGGRAGQTGGRAGQAGGRVEQTGEGGAGTHEVARGAPSRTQTDLAEQPTDQHPPAPAIAGEAGAAFGERGESPSPSLLESAVLAFNASEFPRRVRGVMRSLGQPEISVRPAEHLDSAIRIVVAWELCWYRYEIDFSEPAPYVRMLAQGSELGQLERTERDSNAILTPGGALALAAVA